MRAPARAIVTSRVPRARMASSKARAMKSAAARRASDEARAASGSPMASGVDQARRDEGGA